MPQYRFDIDANTKKAEQNINDLLSLLGRVDKAAGNASKVDNQKNDNKTLELLNDYKKLESSYKNIADSAKKFEQSPNFSGKTTDFQHLNSELDKSSGLLAKVSRGINSLGAGGGNNLKEYVRETENMKLNLGDNVKLTQQLQRIKSRARRVGNQQDRISAKVSSTGYMSLRDWGTYTRNQAELKNLPKQQENINGIIHDKQDEYNSLQKRIVSGLNTEGKPMDINELNDVHKQMNDITKLLHKARDANTAIDAAQDTGATTDMTIASGLKFIGSKAALPLMFLGIGKQLFSAFKNAVKEGSQINQSTGEQALNMGNISGHASDSEMRGRVQGIMWNNGLGYTTQQGLDYMSLAQQSRSYNPDKHKDQANGEWSSRVTNALEEGGRSAGVSDKTWKNAATAMVESGAPVTDASVKQLTHTIAGENMRSGNPGNAESNANIVTSVIQGLTRSGTLNTQGINTAAATTAIMSRSSKLFSGQQGEENINNFNQGFLNAGSGKDDALLYMKIQSNPARYGGGARGLLNAQEDLNKGLSDIDNVGSVRDIVRRLGSSGLQGQATAALFLEQHFGWKAEAADKVSQDMLSGKYSDSQIQKEMKKVDKEGKQQAAKNLAAYQNSDQATYNTQQAQGDALKSATAGITKWWRDAKNNVGHFFGSAGNNIGKFFGNIRPIGTTNLGGGILGTTNVHASSSLTKAEKEKDRKNRIKGFKASGKTSAGTISEKEKEASRTKAYLNTRDEEKNLRNEKDNIDLRESQLKEFSRLLKDERNLSGSHGAGKAGTVGKSSLSSSKSKSKKSASSKAKNKPRGSTKKTRASKSSKKTVSKNLTNKNNITINMPASSGNPAPIGAINQAGQRVGETIGRLSHDYMKGD